jgi:hypothetical protein
MSSQWIEMNVTNQLSKVYILIADDRMISVLKQMPMPKMAKVVGDGMAGQETPHEFRKSQWATS